MNSEMTQIHRRNTTAPTRWLLENVDFGSYKTMLHFGEGRAFPDTRAFEEEGLSVWGFDPGSPHAWKRNRQYIDPSLGLYDVGVSNYVFNTLLPDDRRFALMDMLNCCQRCYISVRTDRVPGEKWEDGVITQRNTFQTQYSVDGWRKYFVAVSPEWASVSVLHNGGHFCIIEVSR